MLFFVIGTDLLSGNSEINEFTLKENLFVQTWLLMKAMYIVFPQGYR